MQNIDRVEKTQEINNIRFIKKDPAHDQFETLLRTYSSSPDGKRHKEKNKDEQQTQTSDKVTDSKIKLRLKQIQTALDQAVKKFNDILDARKIKYFVFYEVLKNESISIKVADVKSGEYLYQHTICLDCITDENEAFRLIEDLAKKEGLLVDINA